MGSSSSDSIINKSVSFVDANYDLQSNVVSFPPELEELAKKEDINVTELSHAQSAVKLRLKDDYHTLQTSNPHKLHTMIIDYAKGKRLQARTEEAKQEKLQSSTPSDIQNKKHTATLQRTNSQTEKVAIDRIKQDESIHKEEKVLVKQPSFRLPNFLKRSPSQKEIVSDKNTITSNLQTHADQKDIIIIDEGISFKEEDKSKHTYSYAGRAGQTPYTLNQVIELVKNIFAKKFRTKGETATAPIKLTALNEGVEKAEKQEDTHKVAIYKAATENVEDRSIKRKGEVIIKETSIGINVLGMKRPSTYLPGETEEERSNCKAFAETDSYLLSELLDFKVVPETGFVWMNVDTQDISEATPQNKEDNSELGTVQVFNEKQFKTVAELKETGGYMKITRQALARYQLGCFLRGVMGALDDHKGNTMVKVENGVVTDYSFIDNGLGFGNKFPKEGDKRILENSLATLRLKEGNINWLPEVREKIASLTPEQIVKFRLERQKATEGLCITSEKKDNSKIFYDDTATENMVLRFKIAQKDVLHPQGSPQKLADKLITLDKVKLAYDPSGENGERLLNTNRKAANKIIQLEREKLASEEIKVAEESGVIESVTRRSRRKARGRTEMR